MFKMKLSREWFTPLTMGSFFLLAVTGVLMFFHLDSGMNKLAHQWLSWLLLAAVVAHATSNGFAFKRHLTVRRAQWILVGMALLTALTFLPGPAKKPNAQKLAVKVFEEATLRQVAGLKGRTIEQMQAHLRAQGVTVQDEDVSLKTLARHSNTDLQIVLVQALSIP